MIQPAFGVHWAEVVPLRVALGIDVVEPHIVVPMKLAYLNGSDPQLERALEEAAGRVAEK